jgi:hypothetical protein
LTGEYDDSESLSAPRAFGNAGCPVSKAAALLWQMKLALSQALRRSIESLGVDDSSGGLTPPHLYRLRAKRFFQVRDGDRALMSWLQVEVVVREAGGLVRDFEVHEVGVCGRLETDS